MKTILKIIDKEQISSYHKIANPFNMLPRKDDYIVWKGASFIVDYVEFDFDTNTLYIRTTL